MVIFCNYEYWDYYVATKQDISKKRKFYFSSHTFGGSNKLSLTLGYKCYDIRASYSRLYTEYLGSFTVIQ